MIASSREIVNGSMMPQYTGKKVSVTGLVTKINPNGLTFDVRAMDDVEIKVNLKRPNNDILEGLVQVSGSVQTFCMVYLAGVRTFTLMASCESWCFAREQVIDTSFVCILIFLPGTNCANT